MSLTAIINLAERLLNNSSGQSVDTSSTLKQSKQTARIDSEAKAGDQFTPSTATQQDAGLFQVRQISIFSAAADFLFAQTLQPQSNPLANPAATPENGPAAPAPAKPTANAAPAAIASTATPAVANVQLQLTPPLRLIPRKTSCLLSIAPSLPWGSMTLNWLRSIGSPA